MTELYLATQDTAHQEPLYWGLPLPLLLGLIGAVVSVAGALIAAFSKRWRTPADNLAERKVGIEADERLLKRFQEMLGERDEAIEELRQEVKELAGKVKDLVDERGALIDWIYAAVRVVRDLGGIHLLPRAPKGVVIADHPANIQLNQEAQ